MLKSSIAGGKVGFKVKRKPVTAKAGVTGVASFKVKRKNTSPTSTKK